jgi:hypothetical protein
LFRNPEEDRCARFFLSTLDGRDVTLCDTDDIGQFCLVRVEPSQKSQAFDRSTVGACVFAFASLILIKISTKSLRLGRLEIYEGAASVAKMGGVEASSIALRRVHKMSRR